MEIPAVVKKALKTLQDAGFEAYPVGGCVRDSLLGLVPGDWDICTSALPGETRAAFTGCRLIETGLQHGTLTVVLEGQALEITTFRTDGGYSDGRHPDSVRFTPSLTEDLRRRDFTCNAMVWSESQGIIDPFGGQRDLASGLLRCVGVPEERFREDALRILRALRFAARFGFAIEEETARAIHENRGLLRRISPERIFSELQGILCGKAAGAMLRDYADVFFVFLPELEPLRGFEQHLSSHRHDAWEHTLRTVDAAPREAVLRLAALFHDCAKPEVFRLENGRGRYGQHPRRGAEQADVILRRLRCDNARREEVCALVALHDTKPPLTAVDARRELAALGAERCRALNALRRADAIGHDTPRGMEKAREAELAMTLCEAELAAGGCLSLRQLAIDGDDLLALGIPAGPQLRKMLETLLDAVLCGTLPNEKAALLDAAGRLAEQQPPTRE